MKPQQHEAAFCCQMSSGDVMVHKIYLSGPLFSRGEISWGERVRSFIRDRLDDIEVIWPHEIAPCYAGPGQIFQANLEALQKCDIMVAMLDGAQVDDGTAWEIGCFFMQGKRILGLRTDLRRAGEFEGQHVNLMIETSCLAIANSLDDLLSHLQRLLH